MKVIRRRRGLKPIREVIGLPVQTIEPMPVEKAQKSDVVRVPGFLSNSEIEKLLYEVEQCNLPAYTSNYGEDLDENGTPVHTTTYLQTKHTFRKSFHWLNKRIRKLIKLTNTSQNWGFDIENNKSFNVRVAEFHEMTKGGSLLHSEHYDIGSIITIDIMLHEADKGAEFQTLEVNHKDNDTNNSSINNTDHIIHDKNYMKTHEFHAGDALIFVSHKYHSVTPLIQGKRKVLVIEYWNGKQRCCGHRCDKPFGICAFTAD